MHYNVFRGFMKKICIFAVIIFTCSTAVHAQNYKGLIGKTYRNQSDLKELVPFSSRGGALLADPGDASGEAEFAVTYFEKRGECLITFERLIYDQNSPKHAIVKIIHTQVPILSNYMFNPSENLFGIIDFNKSEVFKLWRVTVKKTTVELVEIPASRGSYTEPYDDGDSAVLSLKQ